MKTDSKFEQRLMQHPDYKQICKPEFFHTQKIKYIVEHTYTPDWSVPNVKGGYDHYEAKGFFRCDPSKYNWIRVALNENDTLKFIHQNGKTYMPNSRRRKDGTRLNHIEWCAKHAFDYLDCRGKV